MGRHDVIVVGARCAGSPTAMLLARKGYRVLLVDRATFPSDTLSTHLVHTPAVAALRRWGLLDRLAASGCPPVDTYAFDFGDMVIEGSPGVDGSPVAYCPRRTVLDKLLIDAAAEAGAEVREGFAVDEVLIEDGRVVGVRGASPDGRAVEERAAVVVGADGRNSVVAEAVRAERYHERPPILVIYYAYWSGLPTSGRFETYVRPFRGCATAPTHDGLTMIVAGWPVSEMSAVRADSEGAFHALLDHAPAFAERVRGGRRETPFSGASTPNFLRKPYGPGWALVGDAGYLKDPITALGILDAFRDAERCAAALDEALSGRSAYDAALGGYQRDRDAAALPFYDLTCQLATLEPPPPEMARLLAAVSRDREASHGFVQVNAGALSPAAFFAPENVEAIIARSQGG